MILRAALLSFFLAAPLAAQREQAEAREITADARAIFDGTMSPFCPGLTISTCPSPSADSLRRAVRDRLDKGEQPAEIQADIARTFGVEVLGRPEVSGFGAVAWFAVPVALLAAGIALTLWLKRGASSSSREASEGPSIPERYDPETQQLLSKIEDAVRRE